MQKIKVMEMVSSKVLLAERDYGQVIVQVKGGGNGEPMIRTCRGMTNKLGKDEGES